MTWPTLAAVRLATQVSEFAPWLAKKHRFVKLPSGRWTRVHEQVGS